jgi:uncharacterized membrane protein YcaP (DUF421 family)
MASWVPDWHKMFVPTTGIPEIVLRGTLMYLGLTLLLRVILKRQSGDVSLTDLLLIVLIADAAQNGMADEYRSVTEGIVLVGTLVCWDYALDWLSYRVHAVRRLLIPRPLLLVKDGRVLQKNLEQESLTRDDLLSHLRQEGVESPRQVKAARLEPGGHISVIPYEESPPPPRAAAEETTPAGDFDEELRRLEEAARAIQTRIQWHEEREAEHGKAVRDLGAALARHGLTPSPPRRTRQSKTRSSTPHNPDG